MTRRPSKVGPEPAEGRLLLVDDRDVVALALEAAGEGGADAAAAHDDEVHDADATPAPAAPCRAPTQRVDAAPPRVSGRALLRTRRQARARRTRDAQRPAGRDPPAQELALPVFASDALSSVAYAPDEIFLTLGLAGGALALTHSWQIGLARRRRHARRRRVLPAERARLPLRWRRLRGRHHQPRAQGRADRGQRAARRLRPDRRGVDLLGRPERRGGARLHPRARGDRRGRPGRPAHRDEPARRARVGHGLRPPGLPVHGQRHRHGASSASSARSTGTLPQAESAGLDARARRRATSRSAASRWSSSCCAPSPPAVRR